MKKKKENEVKVYDSQDTSHFIDRKQKMILADLGIELPPESPTKVLSLRLSTSLLNKIKAYASQNDVPYSAMIKMLLAEGIDSKMRSRPSVK